MPYIAEQYREEVDEPISEILEYINLLEKEETEQNIDGLINYIVTRIVTEAFRPMSYTRGSNMIKTLECSKLEVYRRLLAPYEDQAVDRNGDLGIFRIGGV